MANVGKYTSPMDPMGIHQHVSLKIMRFLFLGTRWHWYPWYQISHLDARGGEPWDLHPMVDGRLRIRLYLRLQICLFSLVSMFENFWGGLVKQYAIQNAQPTPSNFHRWKNYPNCGGFLATQSCSTEPHWDKHRFVKRKNIRDNMR